MGDRVVVTNPEFVTRVGYPLSFEAAYEKCTELYLPQVSQLLCDTVYAPADGSVHKPTGFLVLQDKNFTPEKHSKDLRMILTGLTRMYMKEQKFGGPIRSIHTERMDDKLGMVCEVTNKRTCKTGEYDPPWSYQSYDGDWDCGSGGLTDCKTHVLIELDVFFTMAFKSKDWNKYGGTWIETCNVRRYDGPELTESASAYAKRVRTLN